MSDGSIGKKIEEFLQGLPDKYSILNENIPVEVQLSYFDFTRRIKSDVVAEEVLKDIDLLFNLEFPLNDKKILLAKLASIPEVEAYRAIEKYNQNPESVLSHWAKLAQLESRMLLESFLTDQSQVMISTGLGGRDNKLRYFFVGFSQSGEPINETQQKVIKLEFESSCEKHSGDIENVEFFEYYFTYTLLLPVNTEIREYFKNLIHEINVYGNFLRSNFIITNVKFLKENEIMSFLTLMDKKDKE